MSFQLAIDGPAGAGKSTIAKITAKKLGFVYIDTGAMYRAMGLFFDRNGKWPEESEEITLLADKAKIRLVNKNGNQFIFLNGEDVSEAIRTEKAGMSASKVSAFPEVRSRMVALQRKIAGSSNVVMDGRDIGTVVLPEADLKLFLTASVKERARRRMQQLKRKGINAEISQIEEDIRQRDLQDTTREASPLRQAEDALLLDTSDMTIDQVVDHIISLVAERR